METEAPEKKGGEDIIGLEGNRLRKIDRKRRGVKNQCPPRPIAARAKEPANSIKSLVSITHLNALGPRASPFRLIAGTLVEFPARCIDSFSGQC